MTLADLKQNFYNNLQTLYNQDEIDTIFLIYLEDKFDLNYLPTQNFDFETEAKKDLTALKTGKPIQHITKKAFFYDNFFFVNENTLIPRPETEELIELIRNDFPKDKELNIIDLGTGTGCIPITLSKLFPNSKVSAIDISEKALEVAQLNAKNLTETINFIQQDLLVDFDLDQKFDIIISNPPYIRNLEKDEMHQNVLQFEPHLALFVEDNNALIFYERIISFAKKNLSENGSVYCEINQYLPEETKLLFEKVFNKVELIKDISGNYRMLKSSEIK
ncbi:MAG: peptide chain release factor N(5)-glutamine methyltransferase [Bacilli bacterium]|uniref:peptide chain release factor N(5)-glutamine methyltransferase n=1 Tax=Algoriella sp. TaxID=1872434 RepID=UPI002FCACEF2